MDKEQAIEKLNDIRCHVKETSAEEQALVMAIDALKQPVATDTNVGDKISKFIDGLEEIFADLRERHVDDSVCGLCEYDGAYMGQSGDWCNECPGFDRDDCFKLSDETRKKWTDEIIKALPTIQPQPQWILCDERMPEEHEWIGTKKFGTTISDEVYVTFENEKGERFCQHMKFQNGELSRYDQFHMDTWFKGSKPIAWMPLPKPFEGGTE